MPPKQRPTWSGPWRIRADFAEAWSDLGEAKRKLLDDDGALQAFRRSVELNPNDAVAQTRLGSNLLNRGEAHQAIGPLQHAAGLDPNNQSTLNALQMALRRDGQREQADAVKRRLAELLRDKDHADQKLVSALELNNRGSVQRRAATPEAHWNCTARRSSSCPIMSAFASMWPSPC